MKMKKVIIFSLFISLFILVSMINLFGQQKSSKNMLKINLPGKNWALEVSVKGFNIKGDKIMPDGMGRSIYAENPSNGIIMSIFLEKAVKIGNSRDCRNYYWNLTKESPLKNDNIKMSEIGQMAIVEYFVKEYKGVQIDQKNLHAYLAKDDIWIDIHLSKVKFKPEDTKLFNAILKTVKIVKL